MNMDFSSLIANCSPQQINCIFAQLIRLKTLMDQKTAFQFLKRIKEEKKLEELLTLSDQDILKKYSFKQPQKPTKAQNKVSKQQQIINQKKKYNQRLQRQLLENLKQFFKFNKFQSSLVKKIMQFTVNYIQNTKVLDRKGMEKEISKLKNKVPNFDNIHSFLRVVDSALYYTTPEYRLRQTQIIALLFFLVGRCPKILLEILTGEGKSTTVSSLAAILKISGKEVDIVTTSEILAKRDVQEKKSFYKLLGLEVDHNFEQNQKDGKKCYLNNKIVYGTPHSFQVDILFDQYKKRGTRCKRPYTVLIVDEVDSMFIDQKDHQTLLASTFPGFSELIYPMKIIWNRINCNPIFQENEQLKMALAVGKNETVTGKVKDIMNQVIQQIREKYQNEIIPKWRMKFIKLSLQKWIQSAICAAFVYKEKIQYVVRNGKIIPVDYKNNGALQEGVNWENGLHQFLQIKHGLFVTTEGMTSNFISNLGHFDKYRDLYGLTGTLGSDIGKSFLQKTYKADLMKIPPFKERKLKILPGDVLDNDKQWAIYICKRVKQMLDSQRSVLILCQTIAEAKQVSTASQINQIKPKRIQKLQTGQQKIDDNIGCGQVIIATNLAGRGSDFKITQELNEKGGLHVIIAFMPINSRVQMQGRGRAGRNGSQGSSQLAVNYIKLCEQLGLNEQSKKIVEDSQIEKSKLFTKLRDDQQTTTISQDQKRVDNLRCKDKVFSIYCEGVNKIPDFQKNTAKQQALEENFAMFLKQADMQKQQSPDNLLKQATKIVQDYQNNSEGFYNPNHLVGRGINYLCQKNRGKAIQMFQKAEGENNGSMSQILGGIYGNCCKLNRDKDSPQKIQSTLKKLNQTLGRIEKQKELIKGSQIIDSQLEDITANHNKMNERDNKMFQNKLKGLQQLPLNTDSQSFAFSQSQTLKDNTKPMSSAYERSAHERVLDGLAGYIKDILKLFENLKQGQYVQIRFEPISKLLDTIDGNRSQNQNAMRQKIPDGLQLVVQGKVQKKVVPLWKRVTVFLLGVAQFVIGAIIVASTGGALMGFGVTMMAEGIKYCYDSIFEPEQLEDLSKYFTQTAIKYACALVASGLEGIKQLGTLCKNGWRMFKQMPLGQFFKTTLKKVGEGCIKGGAYSLLKTTEDKIISRGMQNYNIQNPTQVIHKAAPLIKQKIKQQQFIDAKLDLEYQKIRGRFEKQITQKIKNIILKEQKSTLQLVKNLPLNQSLLSKIISKAVNQHLKLPKEGRQVQEMKEKLKSKWGINEPQVFMKTIHFEQKIVECLRNLPQNQDFGVWILHGLSTLIQQGVKKMVEEKQAQLKTLKSQLGNLLNEINNNLDTMPVNVYKTKVAIYQQKQKQYNSDIQTFNKFVKQYDVASLMQKLKQKKAIQKNGRLNAAIIKSLQIHEYTKEFLLKLQYKGSQVSSGSIMEAAIFNAVGNYGIQIMDRIFVEKGGSQKRLDDITKLFRK